MYFLSVCMYFALKVHGDVVDSIYAANEEFNYEQVLHHHNIQLIYHYKKALFAVLMEACRKIDVQFFSG